MLCCSNTSAGSYNNRQSEVAPGSTSSLLPVHRGTYTPATPYVEVSSTRWSIGLGYFGVQGAATSVISNITQWWKRPRRWNNRYQQAQINNILKRHRHTPSRLISLQLATIFDVVRSVMTLHLCFQWEVCSSLHFKTTTCSSECMNPVLCVAISVSFFIIASDILLIYTRTDAEPAFRECDSSSVFLYRGGISAISWKVESLYFYGCERGALCSDSRATTEGTVFTFEW